MSYAVGIDLLPGRQPADQAGPLLDTPAVNEESLVASVFGGDEDAFRQMVVSVQRTAYYLLKSEEAAEDVVQESLIKALRALHTFRRENFKSWFKRILINSCYDLLRYQKRRSAASLEELTMDGEVGLQIADTRGRPDEYVERMEMRHLLEQGIATLPAEQRITLVLHDVEGYSYEEIAGITGVPMGTVKSRLSRGRIQLRNYLLRHEVLPARQRA